MLTNLLNFKNHIMKKLLLIVLIFFSFYSNSQTTIYSTTLNKDKLVVKYKYLQKTNKLILKESNEKKMNYAIFNKATIYDSNSKSNELINNEKFIYVFNSLNEENFGTLMQDGVFSPLSLNFSINNKKTSFQMKSKDFERYSFDFEGTALEMKPTIYFDENYIYTIINENGRTHGIEIAKDALQLDKFNIAKQTSSLISLKKIDTDRLKSKDLALPKQIAFQSKYYNNNTLEIVTKSINKDYKTSTLYRDIYDLDGKFIKEISYNYNSIKGFLVPTYNNSTFENMINSYSQSPGSHRAAIELDVNDYYIDPKTNEFYIYGITAAKDSNGLSYKSALGFYINKYSEKGEKIWEKFYDVSDEKGFNQKSDQRPLETKINLKQFTDENQLVLSIVGFKTYTKQYYDFFVINKNSGKMEDSKSANSDSQTSKGTFSYGGKFSLFEIIELDKNKFCDENTILTTTFNLDLKKYINKIAAKDDVFFNSILSAEGIWLMETDNKTYYKVSFFK